MERTLGERATFVAAAIGLIAGALFLFAPIHGICSSSAIATAAPPGATAGPPATFGPATCGAEALWQRQQLFPMPFIAIAVWSLAPTVVHLGARMRAHDERTGTVLMVLGLITVFTSIVSFGAAYFFVPFVALPTLIATAIAFASARMG